MIAPRILMMAKRPCPICRNRHKEYTEIVDTRVLDYAPAGIMTNCIQCQHVDYYADAAVMKRLAMPDGDGLRMGRTILIDPHLPCGYRYGKEFIQYRKIPTPPYLPKQMHLNDFDFKVTLEEKMEDRYH